MLQNMDYTSAVQTKLEQKCAPVLAEFGMCVPSSACACMCIGWRTSGDYGCTTMGVDNSLKMATMQTKIKYGHKPPCYVYIIHVG